MIGKKSGALSSKVPKYFSARGRSSLPYAALAGRVQGGLLPGVLLSIVVLRSLNGNYTAADINAAEEDGMESTISLTTSRVRD